ncbi:MAG: tetratricopeptide repeat protein [Anaerolineales bacterium]
MTSFIADLKSGLPEFEWPVVVSALRNEAQVWVELQDSEFAQLALKAAAGERTRWSPAFLGLLRLGQTQQFEALRKAPMQPVGEKLRYQAAATYEELASLPDSATRAEPDLAQAALLALALRERRRMLNGWEQLANDLSIAQTDFWKLPLACLLGFVPNQHELLQHLLSPEQPEQLHQLAIHALVSNPLGLDIQASHLSEIIQPYELPQLLKLLRSLTRVHPTLAQQLALQALDDLREAGIAQRGGLGEIQELLLQAEIHQIGGQNERANPLLQSAWEAAQRLQLDLAAKVAKANGVDEGELLAVRQSAELANPKTILAAKAGTKGPSALLAAARVALQDEDAAEAKKMAVAALQVATKETSAEEMRDKAKLLCDLGSLLMDMDLPREAELAAKAAADLQANDGESAALLSRVLLAAGKSAEALEQAHLAAALAPEQSQVRRQLAEALQGSGQFEAAFKEWKAVLEHSESPSVEDWLALAATALQSGKIEETIAACHQTLMAQPASAAAYALMGKAVALQGDEDSAVEFLTRATELAPAQVDAWLSLAEILLGRKNDDKALATLLSAQKYADPSAMVQALIAGIYDRQNRAEEAMAAYQRAAQLANAQADGETAQQAAVSLGAMQLRARRVDAARATLEAAQKSFPDNAAIARLFGKLLLDAGEPKRALVSLQIAAQVNPDDMDALMDVGRAQLASGEQAMAAEATLTKVLTLKGAPAEAKALLAEALAAQAKHNEAAKQFEAALTTELAKDPAWVKRLTLGTAAAQSAGGKPVAALHTLEALAKSNPTDLEVLRALCSAYQQAGRADEAAEIARKVYADEPGNESALLWYAETMQALGKSALACQVLGRTNKAQLSPRVALALGKIQWHGDSHKTAHGTFGTLLHGEDAEVNAAAGAFLLQNGAAKESLAYYQKALNLAGPQAQLFEGLTQAYLQTDQATEALDYLEQGLALEPNKPANLALKAEILQRLGRPQAALKALNQALELLPNEGALLTRKAVLLRETGDWNGALTAASKAFELDLSLPANVQAAAELAVLCQQPDKAREIIRTANLTGSASTDLACLQTELALDAGHEIEAAKLYASNLEKEPSQARILALQSQLAACRGDRTQAAQLLQQGMDGYKNTSEIHTALGLASAAEKLNEWDLAIKLYKDLTKAFPGLSAAQFGLGRALTLQAEWQQLCQASQAVVVQETKGSLKEARAAARQAFEAAASAAGEAANRAMASGWAQRAELRFGAKFEKGSLANGFPANAAEAAALAFAQRAGGKAVSGDERLAAYLDAPEVLVERALGDEPELITKAAAHFQHVAPIQALAAYYEQAAGHAAAALQHIQRALALWPSQPRWQALAGELHSQLGNTAEAAAHFALAAELEPEQASHYYGLGQAQLAGKSISAAVSSLQKAVDLQPKQGDYLLALATAQRQSGDAKAAKASAGQAHRMDPNNAAALLMQAELSLEAKDASSAKNFAEEALKVAPKDTQALRQYAEALYALGQGEDAVAVLERALETAEDEVPLLIRSAEMQADDRGLRALVKLSQKYTDRPEVFYALSLRLALAGNLADAVQAAQRAAKKADKMSGEEQADIHLHLGRLLKHNGNLDQSLHHLDEATRLSPHLAESQLERGRVFIARRQHRQAMEAFRRAAAMAPESAAPHYEAGLALKEAKDYSAAESELRQAARLAPKDRTIQRQLATVIALNLVHHRQEAGVEL